MLADYKENLRHSDLIVNMYGKRSSRKCSYISTCRKNGDSEFARFLLLSFGVYIDLHFVVDVV